MDNMVDQMFVRDCKVGTDESKARWGMKTQYCAECFHFAYRDDDPRVCTKSHKPRFYPPQTVMDIVRGEFGWKRKCEDFVLIEVSE